MFYFQIGFHNSGIIICTHARTSLDQFNETICIDVVCNEELVCESKKRLRVLPSDEPGAIVVTSNEQDNVFLKDTHSMFTLKGPGGTKVRNRIFFEFY